MRTDDFDYFLPEELIAQTPLLKRETSRLLVLDKKTGEYGIACVWNIGVPTVFPPYFDYVKIKDEDDGEFMVRRKDFFTFVDKFLTEIGTCLPDMYMMKAKAAHKSRNVINKLKKFAILDQTFTSARLCDLIDDDKYEFKGDKNAN